MTTRRFRFILPDGQRDENAIERAAQRRLGHYRHIPNSSWQAWRHEVLENLEIEIMDEFEAFNAPQELVEEGAHG